MNDSNVKIIVSVGLDSCYETGDSEERFALSVMYERGMGRNVVCYEYVYTPINEVINTVKSSTYLTKTEFESSPNWFPNWFPFPELSLEEQYSAIMNNIGQLACNVVDQEIKKKISSLMELHKTFSDLTFILPISEALGNAFTHNVDCTNQLAKLIRELTVNSSYTEWNELSEEDKDIFKLLISEYGTIEDSSDIKFEIE